MRFTDIDGRSTQWGKLKMGSNVRSQLARLGVFLLVGIGLIYWLYRSFIIVSGDDAYRFADNGISGVRFSRYMDSRPPAGRVVGMNAYVDFIVEATKIISAKRGGYAFVDQPMTLEERSALEAKNDLMKVRLVPKTDEDWLFGIQSSVRFKLQPSVGLLSSIRNRWVVLTDRISVQRLAFLESIDETGVARIRGQLPIDYFPTTIDIIGRQGNYDHAYFSLIPDFTHAVRGGALTTKSGRFVVVRQLPFLKKIPLAKLFKYRPMIADKMRLRSGGEFSIVNVMEFEGNFVLELDHSINPYFDSNDDIVTILPQEDHYSGVQRLKISSSTDNNFALGRERYYSITLDMGDNRLSSGDFIIGGPGETPYYIAGSSGNAVSIDILETALSSACSRFLKLDDRYHIDVVSGNMSLHSAINRFADTCKKDQSKSEILREIIEYPQPTDEWRLFISKVLSREKPSILTHSEIFNRGLDFQVYIHCEDCSEKSHAEVGKIPKVEGFGDIWEIYPGSALNLFYGDLNKAKPEMMIHALGKENASTYYSTFESVQPSFVAVTKPRQFTPWLYNWHWYFFELLLRNYREHYSNSEFSLWYRYKPSWTSSEGQWDSEMNLKEGSSEFSLPPLAENLSVYTIELRYEVSNPLHALPLVGKSARLIIEQSNTGISFPVRMPVSLPLNEVSYRFPVFTDREASPKFRLHIIDPFGTNVKVKLKSVSWRQVPVPSQTVSDLILYAPPFRALGLE